jgi:hypothetical protein
MPIPFDPAAQARLADEIRSELHRPPAGMGVLEARAVKRPALGPSAFELEIEDSAARCIRSWSFADLPTHPGLLRLRLPWKGGGEGVPSRVMLPVLMHLSGVLSGEELLDRLPPSVLLDGGAPGWLSDPPASLPWKDHDQGMTVLYQDLAGSVLEERLLPRLAALDPLAPVGDPDIAGLTVMEALCTHLACMRRLPFQVEAGQILLEAVARQPEAFERTFRSAEHSGPWNGDAGRYFWRVAYWAMDMAEYRLRHPENDPVPPFGGRGMLETRKLWGTWLESILRKPCLDAMGESLLAMARGSEFLDAHLGRGLAALGYDGSVVAARERMRVACALTPAETPETGPEPVL